MLWPRVRWRQLAQSAGSQIALVGAFTIVVSGKLPCFDLKRVVVVAVAEVVPEISDGPTQKSHAFGLMPMTLLMQDKRSLRQAVGQNEDAERRQADPAVPCGLQKKSNNVAGRPRRYSHVPIPRLASAVASVALA
jgi:hypothetical protein